MENVFKNRNFRLVFLGALVSEIGAVLYSFAVSFYILEITGNNAFLQGLYLALCGGVLLLLTPVGGVLGDRFNKAKIMFICDYLKGGLILAATVLMMLFRDYSQHVVILFTVGILGSIVSGIFNPASSALLPHIVAEEKLQQANSYFSIKNSLLSILGVVLAGVLYASLPIHVLFLAVGLSYIASGISEMFIRYEQEQSEEKLTVKLALHDMKDGMRYLKAQKAIMALLVAILFINFFLSPVMSNFIPFFIKTEIATAKSYVFDRCLTPELWSSALSVLIGISSLITAGILSVKKQGDKCGKSVTIRLLLQACLMVLITVAYYVFVDRGVSLNSFLIMLCIGSLVIGFLLTGVNIPINTAIMKTVEKDKLSKVSSIISITAQGLVPIASVLAGAILQSVGSTALLAVCSVGFLTAALILLFNKAKNEI